MNHIQTHHNPELDVVEIEYVLGKELIYNEDSSTKLYALAKKSGWILRVTPFKSLAYMWKNSRNRVHEVHVLKITPLPDLGDHQVSKT